MRAQRHAALAAVAALASLMLAACASTQARYTRLGDPVPARAATAPVEIFMTGAPSRPFRRVARLDVHLEKTGFVKSTFEQALPELQKQARLAGADAIVDVEERRSQVMETMVYHVSAIAVRYE